jgi:hypothetical protein
MGVVQAAGCTPSPQTPICITTDKTTYSPGDTVHVTVTVRAPFTGATSISVEIVPVYGGSVFVPTVAGTVSVSGGTVALTLPNSITAGLYDVGVLVFQGDAFTLNPVVGITVTNPTPVPESPSVLGLLLSALLVGIYVLRRQKNDPDKMERKSGRLPPTPSSIKLLFPLAGRDCFAQTPLSS